MWEGNVVIIFSGNAPLRFLCFGSQPFLSKEVIEARMCVYAVGSFLSVIILNRHLPFQHLTTEVFQ